MTLIHRHRALDDPHRARRDESHDERQSRLDRAHQDTTAKQEASIAAATSYGRSLTADDEALLLAPDASPDHVLAEMLRRTLYAV